MMGEQGHLFYAFDLEAVVPDDHQVRRIAAVLDLSWVRVEFAPHYSNTGRPSVDPELMIRMLILGYVFAIRSERALCSEVQLNLAYRWFCGLGIEDKIPDHSAFTRARNERFRNHDVFRHVFERVVASCIKAGPVGGNGFAVDASLIAADANKCRSTPGDKWSHDIDPTGARRAVQDYLVNLDDEEGIAPHIPVIDKSQRDDGTFSRDDFIYDEAHDHYVCPSGKVTRHEHEAARDVARAIAKTAAYEQTRRDRKKVEMLFAHLKRILRLSRLRLRGPAGAQFEFTLAAIAQNLRRLAKLALHPPDMAGPCVA
ncbi:transposase [Bradyrhizobium sp. LM2.7]